MDNQTPQKKQSFYKLDTTVDSIGTPMELWYYDSLGGSPAMLPFLKTYVELMERGWASPHLWENINNFNVICCIDEQGKVLAGIAFEYRPRLRQGWIILTFTDPNARGRHINQTLQGAVEEVIKARGGHSISSHIHKDNTSALKSAQRVGRTLEYFKTYKSLV
jgi:hypothetical protein